METTRAVAVNLNVNEAIHYFVKAINNQIELLSTLKYYFKNLNLKEVTDIELYIQQLKDIQLNLNDKLNTYEKQTLTVRENKL
jgi:hypothetical protein